MSENKVRLRSFMQKLDALWGGGEVLAHDLKNSEDADEKQMGGALLDLIGAIQDDATQSGLTDLDD